MTVLEILIKYKYTKDHPANREAFANHLGISDRALRKEIENLRDQGYPICSNTHAEKGKGGYWLAKNLAEYEKFSPEYTSRAKRILERDRKMRGYFIPDGQVTMFGERNV